MNRAEKRRADRVNESKTKIYTLTQAQIDSMKKRATDDAVSQAFILMLGLPVMVLHDKYAKLMRKETRLINFADEVLELYDSFNRGYITLDDLIKTIYEETGVKIEYKEERNKL